ncbi:MAG: hypothetical protein Ta2E_10650 [Mycoplasmoidaceae bacterium]|nr:MAG: hypothetical protein Ta2E_10650 [Mycoplasmoidaceae bacterium]
MVIKRDVENEYTYTLGNGTRNDNKIMLIKPDGQKTKIIWLA